MAGLARQRKSSRLSPIGVTPVGDYVSSKNLPSFIQQTVKKYRGLVLVREKVVGNRCWGTLWSKGKVLCFTVEDIPRDKKVYGVTAIPASDDASWEDAVIKGDKVNVKPSSYYITLDDTSNKTIAKGYVKLNIEDYDEDDQKWVVREKNVVPRVSTSLLRYSKSSGGYKLGEYVKGDKTETAKKGFGQFGGIRIHQGTSEKSSEGCIIVSRTRNSDGTLKTDLGCAMQLTKFIYNEEYYNKKALVIFDAFKIPKDQSKKYLLGKVVDGDKGEALKKAKVLYPEEVKQIRQAQKATKSDSNIVASAGNLTLSKYRT
jgi:hypothetical protein